MAQEVLPSRSAGGFTLIEVVVSISLVALLSGALLVGFLGARRASSTRYAAEEFAGFLRETAALTVNGVKDSSCGKEPPCSQYVVSYASGSGAYDRKSVGGASGIAQNLPPGTTFRASGRLTFILDPPTLSVNEATGPADTLTVPVAHRQSPASPWNVCVGGTGNVFVTKATC